MHRRSSEYHCRDAITMSFKEPLQNSVLRTPLWRSFQEAFREALKEYHQILLKQRYIQIGHVITSWEWRWRKPSAWNSSSIFRNVHRMPEGWPSKDPLPICHTKKNSGQYSKDPSTMTPRGRHQEDGLSTFFFFTTALYGCLYKLSLSRHVRALGTPLKRFLRTFLGWYSKDSHGIPLGAPSWWQTWRSKNAFSWHLRSSLPLQLIPVSIFWDGRASRVKQQNVTHEWVNKTIWAHWAHPGERHINPTTT